MNKYNYYMEDNKLKRVVMETFPNSDILDRQIEKGSINKKAYLKALEGIADKPTIDIEEKWYKLYNNVVELTTDLQHLKDQLTGKPKTIEEDEVIKVTDSSKIEEINNLIKKLEGYDTSTLDDNGDATTIHTDGLIDIAEDKLNKIEVKNPWLLKYRGVETDVERPVPKYSVAEHDIKKIIRFERDSEVRDGEDSIADLAKMISLAFSTISALWIMVDDDKKSMLPSDKKAMIDYSVAKFALTETRADSQLLEEGTKLVDKLFSREVNINNIIKRHK